MIFDKHYENETPYITMQGITPFANSMPIDLCFLGKKFKKQLKNSNINCLCYMNVAYDKPQDFQELSVLEWKLHDDSTDVFLIEEKKLFVKGKHFWVYCVGIIEDDNWSNS